MHHLQMHLDIVEVGNKGIRTLVVRSILDASSFPNLRALHDMALSDNCSKSFEFVTE